MKKLFFWVTALFYIVDKSVIARFNEKLAEYKEEFPKIVEVDEDDEDDSNPSSQDSLTPVSVDTTNII